MKIKYSDKKTEKMCEDIEYAQKHMERRFALKLNAKINFIRQSDSCADIYAYRPLRCHFGKGNYKDHILMDVDGTKCSYRIVARLIDNNGNVISFDDNFFNQFTEIEIINIKEVTNHYE